MIDPDLIDNLESEYGKMVKAAFVTIGESGLVESMQDRLLTRLASGAQEEDEDKLATRIKEYRRAIVVLHEFKQLSESFKQG